MIRETLRRPAAVFAAGTALAFAVNAYISAGARNVFLALGVVLSVFTFVLPRTGLFKRFGTRSRAAVASALLLSLGAVIASAWCGIFSAAFTEQVVSLADTYSHITAVVKNVSANSVEADVTTDSGERFSAVVELPYGASDTLEPPRVADSVELDAYFELITSEKDFDAESYYAAKGNYLRAVPFGRNSGYKVIENGANGFGYFYLYVRRWMLSSCDALFGSERGYYRALLAGDKRLLPEETKTDMSDAGVAHIFVVSGMHLYFLASLFAIFGRKRSRFAALPLIFLFTAAAGFGASTVRAAIMLAIGSVPRFFDSENDPLTTLAVTFSAMCFINPAAILGAGMLLSFGAALGLVLWARPINKLLNSPAANMPRVPKKLWSYFAGLLSATVAASAIVTPLSALYFDRISLISPLANLAVLPVMSLCFTLGAVAMLVNPIFAPAARFLAVVCRTLMRFTLDAIAWFADVPMGSVGVGAGIISAALVISAAILVICALFRSKILRRYAAPGLIIAALTASIIISAADEAGVIYRVTAFDAGTSPCALIECGGRNIAVNAGKDAVKPLVSRLRRSNSRALDALVLTDDDARFTGGVRSLSDSAEIALTVEPGETRAFTLRSGDGSRNVSVTATPDYVAVTDGENTVALMFAPAELPSGTDLIIADAPAARLRAASLFTGDNPVVISGGTMRSEAALERFGGRVYITSELGDVTVASRQDGLYFETR